MTSARFEKPHQWLYATLASGAQLVPCVSPECSGPDVYGAPSCVPAGAALPCQGATWHYRGEDGMEWAFVFRPGVSVCPAAMLAGRSGRLWSTLDGDTGQPADGPRVPEDGVRLALSLARESLLSYPGDTERAARAVRAALGWSIERARWFIQVNRDHLPNT